MKDFFKKLAGPMIFAIIMTVALVAGPSLLRSSVDAQPVPSVVGPYNLDTGLALITNVAEAQNPSKLSANVANIDQSGAVCTYYQTAHTGSPSTLFAIQGFDAATASWLTYVVSGAITTSDNTPYPILVYPGAVATSLPTNMVVAGLPLPRVWRVSETTSGVGATITAKIGCNVLR